MNSSMTRMLGATLLLASPLAAQQGAMPMGDCPMLAAAMHGPAAALGARSALRLSATQVSQLEAVQKPLKQLQTRMMDSMKVLHRQIADLERAPRFDEPAARATFERMGRVHVEMGVAMLRARHEVAAILTPQQRDSLEARARMRPGRGMDAGMCAEMMDGRGRPAPMRPGDGRRP